MALPVLLCLKGPPVLTESSVRLTILACDSITIHIHLQKPTLAISSMHFIGIGLNR